MRDEKASVERGSSGCEEAMRKGGDWAEFGESGSEVVARRRRRRYARPGGLTYDAAHGRVRAERGNAAEHACVGCGVPAADWAYDNADPREFTDRATGCAYSGDTSHYEPRCRSCHRRHDHARRTAGRAPLDPAAVVMHYRDGLGVKTVARMFGHPPAAVRALLVEKGEPLRKHSAPLGKQRRQTP